MANPQYICSLLSHFILSLSPYPYPFPHIPSSYPQYPIPFISIFPISPSFSHISHPRCTFRLSSLILHPFPHSLSLTPQSRTIHIHRPYTLCHTFSHTHPYLPLYPRCTLSYPYSHVLLLSHQSHIHSILFHMKHINNNSYFHFHIIYYILYNIILYVPHIVSTCLL